MFSSFLADKPKEDASVFNLKRILRILGISNVAYLLAIKCICGVPFGIFQSMFSIVAMDYFKLDPKENGFVLSYAGILGIVSATVVSFLEWCHFEILRKLQRCRRDNTCVIVLMVSLPNFKEGVLLKGAFGMKWMVSKFQSWSFISPFLTDPFQGTFELKLSYLII